MITWGSRAVTNRSVFALPLPEIHFGTDRCEYLHTCWYVSCRIFNLRRPHWYSDLVFEDSVFPFYQKTIPGHKPITSGHVATVQELRSQIGDQNLKSVTCFSEMLKEEYAKCLYAPGHEVSSVSRWISCDEGGKITRRRCKCWWTALLLMQLGLLSMLSVWHACGWVDMHSRAEKSFNLHQISPSSHFGFYYVQDWEKKSNSIQN